MQRAMPALKPQQPTRWSNHVAQVHRAERAAISADLCSALSPAQVTVRKLAVVPHVARVLESQRAPAQLGLFSKFG
jgi:hypothetical protein